MRNIALPIFFTPYSGVTTSKLQSNRGYAGECVEKFLMNANRKILDIEKLIMSNPQEFIFKVKQANLKTVRSYYREIERIKADIDGQENLPCIACAGKCCKGTTDTRFGGHVEFVEKATTYAAHQMVRSKAKSFKVELVPVFENCDIGKKNGMCIFNSKERGCIIPRELRPHLCLTWYCNELLDFVKEKIIKEKISSWWLRHAAGYSIHEAGYKSQLNKKERWKAKAYNLQYDSRDAIRGLYNMVKYVEWKKKRHTRE